jgi:threonine dehydrogenase-like Zn-dependent dehydrogenase
MPLELVAIGRRTPRLREYEPADVEPDEVRVESELSAFKHGTGLRGYRADTRDFTAPFDWEKRLHRENESATPEYPIPLGNMTVGTVVETGEGADRFEVGDRVYGHLPIRETHTVPQGEVRPVPRGTSAEAILYSDPARVGLHVVRTGGVRPGDRVAVFGAGAIGQMTAQLARLAGARRIAVSEPIARRREAARDLGADLVVDPDETDPGERIKEEFAAGDEPGVDAALETSGAYPGLDDAVRATAFGGVVASCGYYAGDASGLDLEGEWHRNSLEMRSVRPPSEPLRDAPRWDFDRLNREALAFLKEGRLSVDGLLDPVVSIERADEGMRLIDERPEESIKLGVAYGA